MPIIVKLFMAIMAIMAIIACSPVVRHPVPLSESKPLLLSAQEYRIQAGDQLEIKFFYNPELNELVIVRPDGRISLQLAAEVLVAGLTPAELNEQLRKKYSPLITKPEIAVIVRSFIAQRLYVDGEVARPGLVTLTDNMTLMQAISQAGGLKDTARTNEVIIVRRTADGKVSSTVMNLDLAIDGTDMKQDIVLTSNDVVYVPKSSIADLNLWIDQYIRKNIPIPFGLGYNLNGGN